MPARASEAGRCAGGAVALLRPIDAARRSAAQLAALGYETVLAPVTQIVATGAQPPDGGLDAMLVTSARAFAFLSNENCARLATTPLFAVGEGSIAAASARDLRGAATVAPDGAALTPLILSRLPRGARLLYLAARDRKNDLEHALAAAGVAVDVVEIYRAEARPAWSEEEISALRACGAALHYSRRNAVLALRLAALAGCADAFRALIHVCLSRDVADVLRADGAGAIALAGQPTEAALFAALRAAAPAA